MVLLPWSDSYSVGHAEIDRQHQNLFAIVDRLHVAIEHGEGKVVLGQILEELLEYTRVHFTYEEQLMREIKYPGLDAHRNVHKGLISIVQLYVGEFNQAAKGVEHRVLDFLQIWITAHIGKCDHEIASHFKTANS